MSFTSALKSDNWLVFRHISNCSRSNQIKPLLQTRFDISMVKKFSSKFTMPISVLHYAMLQSERIKNVFVWYYVFSIIVFIQPLKNTDSHRTRDVLADCLLSFLIKLDILRWRIDTCFRNHVDIRLENVFPLCL